MANTPKLLTGKQVAEQLGLTSDRSVRSIREAGQLAYIMVVGRYMYPRDAVDQFIQNNTVSPCQDQTEDQNLCRSKSAAASITSAGLKLGGAANEARVRAISERLKKPSANSSDNKPAQEDRVIQGKFPS
jgi:hypothetical protein